jgi:hypothetical protein
MLCVLTVGAQGGFSRQYMIPGTTEATACDILERPDHSYVVLGVSEEQINATLISKLTLLFVDSVGVLKSMQKFGSVQMDYPTKNNIKSLLARKEGGFFAWITSRDSTILTSGNLLAFDSGGSLEWEKIFKDTVSDIYPLNLCYGIDSAVLLVGLHLPPNGDMQTIVIKVNQKGTELWRKVISKGNPNVSLSGSILQDSATKKIILAGYQYLPSGTYNSVIFLDSLGNKLLQKSYNNSCGGSASGLIKLRNGGFVIGAKDAEDCQNDYYRVNLTTFDHQGTGSIIYKHSTAGYDNLISVIAERANRDLVCIGHLDSNSSFKFHYIVISPQGKLKRHVRFGRILPELQSDLGRGGIVTHDGGYIMTMQLTNMSGPTPFYIVKMDSLGCDSTPQYCEERLVGVSERNSVEQWSLSPNPADQEISISSAAFGKPFTLYIYNTQGRLIYQQDCQNQNPTTVNVRSFPYGVYAVRIVGTGFQKHCLLIIHHY